MSVEKTTVDSADVDQRQWYRVGGIAALILGTAYIIIVPLYAHVGAAPTGGEAWFKYLPGKTTVWWAILGLSVLTDFLFVPVAFGLYLALKEVNRNAMLLGTAFVGLFVVLDLTVTWSHYAPCSFFTVTTLGARMMSSGRVTSRLPTTHLQYWRPLWKSSMQ